MSAALSIDSKATAVFPGLIGKVALVTGASRAIGAVIARYLAANVVPPPVFLQSIETIQV